MYASVLISGLPLAQWTPSGTFGLTKSLGTSQSVQIMREVASFQVAKICTVRTADWIWGPGYYKKHALEQEVAGHHARREWISHHLSLAV